MIIGKILAKGYIPILTSAEVTDWLLETPLQDDIVFDRDRNSFAISNGAGAAIYTDVATTYKDDLNPNSGTSVFNWETGKGLLLFVRNQVILRVVDTPAADATEVRYNNSTGDFTLFTGQSFGGEWVSILYDNFPLI